jgi:predicted small lipoprotein YifL
MKRQILALLAVMAVAVTLSACGGGGGGESSTASSTAPPSEPPVGTAPRPESPFASAAMYVPTGTESKSFALSDCMRGDTSAAETTVTMATVVVQDNGDMIFSGAVGTATVAELARINFADTNNRQVYGGKTKSSNAGHVVEYYTADGRKMNLSSFAGRGFRSSSPTFSYNCSAGITTATLVFQQPLSQARVVNSIVTGSTGTVDIRPGGSSPSYTLTASIVSWDSGATTATFARFISFNLDTAQFGQGASLNPSTHTPIPFGLPALGSAINGFYEETLSTTGDMTVFFEYDNIEVQYRRYGNSRVDGIDRTFRFYPI